ncbi:MAG: hypothetical protein AAFN09_03680 [Pseudomonadota bacterium]
MRRLSLCAALASALLTFPAPAETLEDLRHAEPGWLGDTADLTRVLDAASDWQPPLVQTETAPRPASDAILLYHASAHETPRDRAPLLALALYLAVFAVFLRYT